ncbi:hypothetical protein SAMN04487926_12252 [Paraburkholderia steynii]|uniref:Uncharacterized protein n=1 Tax=Paraburkholderia steynii TaxID=1245441 RepID=A0A7Z7BCC0_9BURK|nr:hypothetical protein SAMN04487926_12252 [Paraburkholderia steynii]
MLSLWINDKVQENLNAHTIRHRHYTVDGCTRYTRRPRTYSSV